MSDLCDVLGQSQPRISRHLRLLVDGGVCSRHREGTYAFFSLRRHTNDAANSQPLVDALCAAIDPEDPTIAADLIRLGTVRQRRAEAAHVHFAALAERWDRERSLLTPDNMVESEILNLIRLHSTHPIDVVDLGTGTGRMIELLAPIASRMTGVDSNPAMLRVARANLDQAGIHHAELRQSDIFATAITDRRFDLAVIHQVLHFLDDPDRAISAAADLLNDGGQMLIIDLPNHGLEMLRTEHAHRRLGFTTDQIEGWFRASGLKPIEHRLVQPDSDNSRLIGVGLWLAGKGTP